MAKQNSTISTPNMMKVELSTVNKIPLMLESERDGYIQYGADNQYPDYLLMLMNRSSKHSAIINGKAQYILGQGLAINDNIVNKERVKMYLDNMCPFTDYNEFSDRIIKDLEIFNGIAIEIVWKPNGQYTLNHIPFGRVRSNIDGSMYYYSTNWQQWNSNIKPIEYEPFDINKRDIKKRYIYYYKVYNPAAFTYPIPEYIGSISWINTDIEIANFHYNNITNGFFGGSMITFISGVPTEEEKKTISEMFRIGKTGSDNAGRFVLNFANSADSAPQVTSLIPNDNDKMFDILNKTCTQELFIGHRINSPMLFGVRVEGQLGGRNEIIEAYDMFKKTYINNRQQIVEKILNYHIENNTQIADSTYFMPTEPIGALVNEDKSLMGKQKFSNVIDAINIFKKYGVDSSNFFVLKRKPFSFDNIDKEDAELRMEFYEDEALLKKVLNALGKDSTLTEEQLSERYDIPAKKMKELLERAINDNLIKVNVKDNTPQLEVTNKGNEVIKNIKPGGDFEIKTYYEYAVRSGFGETIIDTTRDFCRELIGLNKIYTRNEIDTISKELGYNAWLLRGGWYHNPRTEVNEPFCRHVWKQILVKEKK